MAERTASLAWPGGRGRRWVGESNREVSSTRPTFRPWGRTRPEAPCLIISLSERLAGSNETAIKDNRIDPDVYEEGYDGDLGVA